MEKIKKLLEDGLFALELDQDRPHTLFEFATIKYDDGCLYIDGEIVENALNEESIDNKLILKSKRSCIEIHSNSIIYQTSDDEEILNGIAFCLALFNPLFFPSLSYILGRQL